MRKEVGAGLGEDEWGGRSQGSSWPGGMEGKEIEWWLGAKSGIRGTKQKYRKGERETVVDRGPKCSAEVRGLGKEGQWHRLQGQVGQGSRAGALGGLEHKGRRKGQEG